MTAADCQTPAFERKTQKYKSENRAPSKIFGDSRVGLKRGIKNIVLPLPNVLELSIVYQKEELFS